MSRRRLRIAFVCTEVAGVAFYRVAQPARALERSGCEVKVLGYNKENYTRPEWEGLSRIPYGEIVRGDIYHACKWADVVVWMAVHTSDSFQLFCDLKKSFPNKPFVMEMDDTVFSIPEHNIASTVYFPGSPLTAMSYSQMKMSDAMVVSTSGLKEQLAPYNDNIHVVENAIDLSLWRPKKYSPGRQGVTIGWVGGATHHMDLESVKDVIFEVLARHKKARFKIVHGCPEFLKHKPGCAWLNTNDPRYDKASLCVKCGGLDGVEWTHDFKSVDKYPQWVCRQRFDIGIAPLEDNNFTRAKSNLRWLEYSAMGIPTVASNVGHFTETLRHGETGFLVNSNDEWIEALDRLIRDADLRKTVGQAAKMEVKKNWDPKSLGKKYKTALREILNAATHAGGPSNSDSTVDRRSKRAEVHV